MFEVICWRLWTGQTTPIVWVCQTYVKFIWFRLFSVFCNFAIINDQRGVQSSGSYIRSLHLCSTIFFFTANNTIFLILSSFKLQNLPGKPLREFSPPIMSSVFLPATRLFGKHYYYFQIRCALWKTWCGATNYLYWKSPLWAWILRKSFQRKINRDTWARVERVSISSKSKSM